MWSLSTSWRSSRVRSAAELLEEVLQPEPDALELDYRITRKTFSELRPLLRERRVSISSIHNYFPLPEEFAPEEASGDLFFLSSPDREHRQTGVKLTRKTIEHASDLEAPAVVLHLGRVDIEVDNARLKAAVDKGDELDPEAARYVLKVRLQREQKKQKHLDAVLFSIEALIPVAERNDVRLGLENRYYLEEIPSFEEIGLLLETFAGAPIGYWHDTGHAHVAERFGLAAQAGFLEAYGAHLIGVHLHDVVGSGDHLAPGKGEIDFAALSKRLPKEAIRVVEVRPQETLEEIKEGIGRLVETGVLSE